MSDKVKLQVTKVCGQDLCVASRDGDKLYSHIAEALKADRCVILSFSGVTLLTSAFLNNAIGRLYGEFDERKIRKLIKVKDCTQDDKMLIKAVADNAKKYYRDPERYRRAVKRAMEN